MTDELLSLLAVVISPSEPVRELFRQALSAAPVSIEVAAVDGAAAVRRLADGADLAYLDGALAPAEIAQSLAALRAARKPAFTVLLRGPEEGAEPFEADALAGKPARPDDAKRLVERSIRARLPSRVLVVDDSAAVRGIVRKVLAATRFPLEVAEADDGAGALERLRESDFDLVFLDIHMPGWSGLETLAGIRREKPDLDVVLMTSLEDASLPGLAREQGAGFLKKPFFPADIDAVLGAVYGLRALNPRRA